MLPESEPEQTFALNPPQNNTHFSQIKKRSDWEEDKHTFSTLEPVFQPSLRETRLGLITCCRPRKVTLTVWPLLTTYLPLKQLKVIVFYGKEIAHLSQFWAEVGEADYWVNITVRWTLVSVCDCHWQVPVKRSYCIIQGSLCLFYHSTAAFTGCFLTKVQVQFIHRHIVHWSCFLDVHVLHEWKQDLIRMSQ